MNLETILSYWHIIPVRWAVYATAVLYLLYVYVMRLKRIRDGEGLSLLQKVVGCPVAVVAVAYNWVYARTLGFLIFRRWPKPGDLTTQTLQHVLDHPDQYAGYRIMLARWLKPKLNRHDEDHLG